MNKLKDVIYCNNCGKRGHNFHQCKLPITSNGIIAFRVNPQGQKEYLMIRRKETLGFIDFIRGKYSVYNRDYVSNMICQMTETEKQMLLEREFDDLWKCVWGEKSEENAQYGNEEIISREKFNQLRKGICAKNEMYNLKDLVDSDKTQWLEPEWGFPKGRRDCNETDVECALREFFEETGYKHDSFACKIIENIMPFDETFMGSNYKSYKHKYFIMNMDYAYSQTVACGEITNNAEISAMQWMPFLECVNIIRQYNLEKRKIFICVNMILTKYACV
jgi:8-oxo-dGTP pyrophosphatase MutT (NUDIX family)